MGLDAVALVMSWEATFGIDIPDDDARDLRSTRQVVDYLYGKLPHAMRPDCLPQRAFYVLRRALVDSLRLDRRSLTPETRFDAIVGRFEMRRVWKGLPATSGLTTWPPLRRPSWLQTALLLLVLVTATVILIVTGFRALPTLAATIITAIAGTGLTLPLRTQLPPELPTLGGVASYLAAHNTKHFVTPEPGWTRAQVRDLVRASVVDELGVSADFDDNAEFVRDLGVT